MLNDHNILIVSFALMDKLPQRVSLLIVHIQLKKQKVDKNSS